MWHLSNVSQQKIASTTEKVYRWKIDFKFLGFFLAHNCITFLSTYIQSVKKQSNMLLNISAATPKIFILRHTKQTKIWQSAEDCTREQSRCTFPTNQRNPTPPSARAYNARHCAAHHTETLMHCTARAASAAAREKDESDKASRSLCASLTFLYRLLISRDAVLRSIACAPRARDFYGYVYAAARRPLTAEKSFAFYIGPQRPARRYPAAQRLCIIKRRGIIVKRGVFSRERARESRQLELIPPVQKWPMECIVYGVLKVRLAADFGWGIRRRLLCRWVTFERCFVFSS